MESRIERVRLMVLYRSSTVCIRKSSVWIKKYRCEGRCTNILVKIEKIFADATSLLCNERLSSEEICYLRSEKQRQECTLSTLISCKQCSGSLSNLQSLLLTDASQKLSATSQLASLQVRAGLIIERIRTVVDIYEI